MKKEITNGEGEVVFSEELQKLEMNCSKCKKYVGYVYSDNATHSKTIGWEFICKECQK